MSEQDTVILATPAKTHRVEAVLTIHRSYTVIGETPEESAARLRTFMRDPGVVADGIVIPDDEDKIVRWQLRRDGAKSKK